MNFSFLQQIEMKSASLAIEPLMLAERDREFLKQLRRNRDAEEKKNRGTSLCTVHMQRFLFLEGAGGSLILLTEFMVYLGSVAQAV